MLGSHRTNWCGFVFILPQLSTVGTSLPQRPAAPPSPPSSPALSYLISLIPPLPLLILKTASRERAPKPPAMAAHKWGTSTKEGDSFPNVAVDIGFVGLDPSNRKMCAGPLPCHYCRHSSERQPQLQLQPAPSSPHSSSPAVTPPSRCCPGRATSTRARRRSGSPSRAHLRPPDPRARSLASRKPRSRASLRRRGSTRCTSSPSTTAPS